MNGSPCPAPAGPERIAAAARWTVREAVADLLELLVPRHARVLHDGEGGAEAVLEPAEAHELACDFVEQLAARGFSVGRVPL